MPTIPGIHANREIGAVSAFKMPTFQYAIAKGIEPMNHITPTVCTQVSLSNFKRIRNINIGGPQIVVRPPKIPPTAPANGPSQRSFDRDKGCFSGLIKVDAEKIVTLTPSTKIRTSRLSPMAS